METHQHIRKRRRAPGPVPATTSEMIQAFWHRLFRERRMDAGLDWLQGFGNVIYADTYASPFIIRLYHDDPEDKRVAYLSAAEGIVEWRFGIKTLGFANCSVVTHPELICWLDSIFWWYVATQEQQKTIGRPSDMRRMVEEHVRFTDKKQWAWKRAQ